MSAYPKRLIEVDLPIKRISAHSRREKSIRHGHISTLHIWWARRPLAACRAVICAALWPDPVDPLCPEPFRKAARAAMLEWTSHERQILLSADSRPRFEAARKKPAHFDDPLELRGALLDFIADFSNWDNSTVKEYLATSRALTQAAHVALGGVPGTRPLVVDPFAGGGAIPLESLRIGADAAASDINDVPVLINRLMLELLPGAASSDFETEFRQISDDINSRVSSRLRPFFKTKIAGERPFAYFWSRTVVCEGPNCGKVIPLIGNPHLSKRRGEKHSVAIEYPKGSRIPIIKLVEATNIGVRSTTKGGAALCICGYATPVTSVRRQLKTRKGGCSDSELLAVGFFDDIGRKQYRVANNTDADAVNLATEKSLNTASESSKDQFSKFPDEKLWGKARMNIGLYGMDTWRDIFTPRQLLVLRSYQEELIQYAKENGLTAPMALLLGIAINKLVDYSTSLCRWVPGGEFAAATLGGEKKLPMMWDFVEIVTQADGPGSWSSMTDWVGRVVSHFSASRLEAGTVLQADAKTPWLPDDSADALITDPPYYDAIWYGDLSDLFAVWLRRTAALLKMNQGLTVQVQKESEIIRSNFSADDGLSNKDDGFYEQGMRQVFLGYRGTVKPTGIAVVVFAHKSTAGWEAMLSGLIDGGWVITSSWPIDTEREARMTSIGQSALASSIHLVCRPRENSDGSVRTDDIGDWRDVLAELPSRIHEWMPRLAAEGVVGADAVFACLGPALEIFSRYSRVEKASGENVTLKEYLEYVWAAVAKEALAQVFKDADTAAFEPDARLTAMWLWTLNAGAASGAEGEAEGEESDDDDDAKGKAGKAKKGGFVLEYDAARKISQGLGANLDDLKHVVEVSGETARLLPVTERTQYLFGKDQAQAPSSGRKKKQDTQMDFFGELTKVGADETAWGEKTVKRVGETTLDRIHQSMILFATGRGEALKRFLVDDGAGNDQRFWRLAQALSALYPVSANEKRWVDGVLARKKGLGL